MVNHPFLTPLLFKNISDFVQTSFRKLYELQNSVYNHNSTQIKREGKNYGQTSRSLPPLHFRFCPKAFPEMSTQHSKLCFQGILELQNSAYSHPPKQNNQGIYYGLTNNPHSKPPHPTSENLMQ